MHYYQKFAVIGLILGVIPVILGIVGLTTLSWISITYDESLSTPVTYDLFRRCRNGTNECDTVPSFRISQYLEITGYAVLAMGIILSVIFTGFVDKRSIHFLTPIVIILGVFSMIIGFIFYIESIFEMNPNSPILKVNFGYSLILMLSTGALGCLLAVYFSFTAGYIQRHILSNVNIY
ncbi:unnamed protein product [Adineta ricciae]|uniref:Uncharacterized protein n=1 Tax=Adineta ricciae TaxID=249248 RepID=A0A813T312_ADIRI|nr:unnamed protein product [Adineta ricciae]CAF1459216.1 unnamed protein product [Adineta ricciae]